MKNEIIGINLLPYSPGMQGGAEVFLRNIVKQLIKIDNSNKYFLFISEEISGKYIDSVNPNFEQIIVLNGKSSRLKRIIYEQFILPYYLYKYKVDVLISNYVVPILSPCKTIGVIHDMQYKRMPELFERAKLFYWNLFIPLTVWKADLIGTISNFSINEIKHFYPRAKKKVFIITEGVKEEIIQNSRTSVVKNIKNEDFILSVATFGKHKNLITLIKAMPIIIKHFNNIKLFLIGEARTPDAISAKNKLLEIIKILKIEKNVIFLGFVSDKALTEYYNKCTAYIFPSLYEGFGLPLIEAQYCGAPVVCSNAGSFPEVGGDSCILFEPQDEVELSEKIIYLLKNEQYRENLIEKGYKNTAKYTWRKGAEDLLDAIEKIR